MTHILSCFHGLTVVEMQFCNQALSHLTSGVASFKYALLSDLRVQRMWMRYQPEISAATERTPFVSQQKADSIGNTLKVTLLEK